MSGILHEISIVLLLLVPVPLGVALLRRVGKSFNLSHPWWGHLPAVSLFLVVTFFAALARIIGGPEIPVMYDNNVNLYPTFGYFLTYFVPIGLLALGVLILVDELWARQEIRKSFNWFSLLDEVVIGITLLLSYGKTYDYHSPIGSGPQFTVSTTWPLVAVVFAAIGLAILLELRRPFAPREAYVAAEETGEFEAELARRAAAGERVAYFEGQNPAYLTVLLVLGGVVLLFGVVMCWKTMPWVSLLLFVLMGAVALALGGLRVSVTSSLLEVRLGVLGIRMLTLPTADVAEVGMPGVGPETADSVRVLSLGGRQGVTIATTLGRRYLIGSDRPERLAAVLRAVTAGAHGEAGG